MFYAVQQRLFRTVGDIDKAIEVQYISSALSKCDEGPDPVVAPVSEQLWGFWNDCSARICQRTVCTVLGNNRRGHEWLQ